MTSATAPSRACPPPTDSVLASLSSSQTATSSHAFSRMSAIELSATTPGTPALAPSVPSFERNCPIPPTFLSCHSHFSLRQHDNYVVDGDGTTCPRSSLLRPTTTDTGCDTPRTSVPCESPMTTATSPAMVPCRAHPNNDDDMGCDGEHSATGSSDGVGTTLPCAPLTTTTTTRSRRREIHQHRLLALAWSCCVHPPTTTATSLQPPRIVRAPTTMTVTEKRITAPLQPQKPLRFW
ncbi:hypothetical protein EDB84DRAFT_1640775 [Lactarius hengduanensis]|nr:hypothetical protein EDB84DRAFT_1640775 [Lactarius hengduanensis]